MEREISASSYQIKRLKNYGPYFLGALFILLFIVFPVSTVILKSFYIKKSFSFQNYICFFKSAYYITILKNSIKVAFFSTVFSLLLGAYLALLAFKVTSSFSKILKLSVLLPIITPGYILSLAYIYLFGREGLITKKFLGIEPNIYGWKSVVILQTLDYTALAFLVISAVLLKIPSELEEAGRNLGLSNWGVFKKIIFPLLLPGFLSAGLLIFLNSLADFETPIIVGGKFNTLATASYFEVIGNFDLPMAATLNVFLLIPSLLTFIVYSKIYREYAYKDVKITIFEIKNPQRTLLFVPAFLYSALVFTLFLAVFAAAFTKGFGYNFHPTINYLKQAFIKGKFAIKNTLVLAITSSLVSGILGVFYAYLFLRRDYPFKKIFHFLILIPFVIPGTFMGIGYLIAFNSPPILLTGTFLILILNCTVRKLPVTYKLSFTSLSQIDKSIEEASYNLGAGKIKTLLKVIFPLLKPAFIFGVIYAYLGDVKTLGSIIFLITAKSKVLSYMLFESVINNEFGLAAAYSFIIVVLSVAGIAVIWKLKGKTLI